MSQFLGLDVGTQGTKGLVIDVEAGTVIARASASYGLIAGLPAGVAEQAPATWWAAVCEVVAALLSEASVDSNRIGGIGVSGQQHGFVPLDESGGVLRPAKLWCDTSTSSEARELSDTLGRSIPTGFTASKILWMKRHEPALFAHLGHVLLPHDWINYRLTGVMWMEAGDASGTGFFDPTTRSFSADAMDAIDGRLAGMLPALVPANAPAGALSAAAASELRLPIGVPVAPGGGDNMMSAIGSGAVRPGVGVISLGTSGTAFAYSPEPLPVGHDIAAFCDSTGGWLPLLCVMNATSVTEEVRRAFDSDLADLTRSARDVPPGCDGLLFIPYLAGERVPDLPEATGTLLGIRPGDLSAGRLFRAAIEGTSFNLAWGIDQLRSLAIEMNSVRVVGGGAKNELWCQILAAILGLPLERLAEPESAALGAALQAAWVVDSGDRERLTALSEPFLAIEGEVIDPDALGAETRDIYAAASDKFRAEVRRLYAPANGSRSRS